VLEAVRPQADSMPRRLPVLALAATIVLWGTAFAAIRAALEHYGAADLGALRLLIAAVVLGMVAAARGDRLPARRDVLPIAGVGFAGMTAYQLLLNSGERTVPAGTASLLVNISPVFTALAASALLHERMSARRWTGVAIAFAGATLIAVSGPGGLSLERGALLVLGAAAAQAAFFVGQKPLLRRYGSLELTAWAMALGALMLLPLAPGLPAAVASAPVEATLAVLFLGVGASAIGFVCWAYACARIDVSVAAATLYAIPVVAFSVGALWLGERPSGLALAGGGIALAGVALVTLSRAQPEAAQDEQCPPAERAGFGQDAERDAGAVGVEERADAEQPAVAQLGEEDDVDHHEAVRGGEAAQRAAMRAE
jgi:drug/metabolite transporter (DMT)-like permease